MIKSKCSFERYDFVGAVMNSAVTKWI